MTAGPRRLGVVVAAAGAAAVLAAAALAACATAPAAQSAPALHLDRPIVLLGEVHANAAGHALRLQAFDALLARGARPALVLEQFDHGDQPALDEARRRTPEPRPADLVAAVLAARGAVPGPTPGSTPGASPGAAPASALLRWEWRFYEPFLERALRHGLPIVAANVGREQARRVVREGLAAHGFQAAVPEDILAGLAAAIESSHCGQVDGALARRMALAQVARDQQMARAVAAHAARGVVLLAGNGHVRRDLGVPRWLDAATRSRTQSVGVLEAAEHVSAFDTHVVVPLQPRPDPCASMRPPVRGST